MPPAGQTHVISRSVLDPTHLLSNLNARFAQGTWTTLVAQGSRFIVQLASVSLLSRFLTPASFGLFALGMSFTGVAAVLVDMGFSTATMQRSVLTEEMASSLFLASSAIGAVLCLLLILAGPAIVQLYHQPHLWPVLSVLALTLPFTALGLQHRAIMLRNMRFAALGAIDVTALTIGVSLGVILAATTHLGAWCLVIMQLTQTITNTFLFWILSGWRPVVRPNFQAAREVLGFGAKVTGFSLMSYFGKQGDNALIGWRWGPAILGQYSRAYALFQMPMTLVMGPITAVAAPALSRVQDNEVRWRKTYVHALSLVLLISAPLSLVVFLFSDQIVSIVLGSQWGEAARVLRYLSLAMFVEPVIQSTTWGLVSMGRGGELFRAGALSTCVILVGFVIGLPFGPAGVAVGYSSAMILILIPRLRHATLATPIRRSDYVEAVLPKLAAGGFTLAAALALHLRRTLAGHSPLIGLCIAVGLVGVVFLATLYPSQKVMDLIIQRRTEPAVH